MNLETIDLARLSEELQGMFGDDPPVGYLRGKTALRDAVIARLRCSALEAEALIDTLESRGFLRFGGDPSERSEASAPWAIESGPHDAP